jgi:hypothetical protein
VLVAGDSETVLGNPEAQTKYFGKRSYHDTGMFQEIPAPHTPGMVSRTVKPEG